MGSQPDTFSTVVAVLSVSLLALLGLSVLAGKISAWRSERSVKPSQVIMSPVQNELPRTEERTERTNERSLHDLLWGEFRLDRRRERLIAVLVEEDLTVTEIRALLKGESTAIGEEVEAAKKRLGKAPSQPYTTPIAQRPTAAQFETDPDLLYHPPLR